MRCFAGWNIQILVTYSFTGFLGPVTDVWCLKFSSWLNVIQRLFSAFFSPTGTDLDLDTILEAVNLSTIRGPPFDRVPPFDNGITHSWVVPYWSRIYKHFVLNKAVKSDHQNSPSSLQTMSKDSVKTGYHLLTIDHNSARTPDFISERVSKYI